MDIYGNYGRLTVISITEKFGHEFFLETKTNTPWEINKMTKNITTDFLNDLKAKAKTSDRKRTHYNLHPELSDPVQRLIMAIEPGSYIRPHRHPEKGKWELFIILKGAAVILVFDDQGRVADRFELSGNGPNHAVEIPEQTWHTLAAEVPGTIMIEVKPGPYAPLSEKDFASWAPAEGDGQAAWFAEQFRTTI